METLAEVCSKLMPVQCRRLLKIGMPFKWQPRSADVFRMRSDVLDRILNSQVSVAQLQEALTPKPKKAGVTRRCEHCTVRDRSKLRVPIWTVYPNGTIALRLEGTRQVEYTTMPAVFAMAVRQRVAAERAQKKGKSK